MIWRESLPARVALATAGLLAFVLAAVTGGAYALTAYMLRQAVDGALSSAITAIAADQAALRAEMAAYYADDHSYGDDDDKKEDDDYKYKEPSLRVWDNQGQLRLGPSDLPAHPSAVEQARLGGQAFVSVVPDGARWVTRFEPDWWQMMTPRAGELRVLYARTDSAEGPLILQMAAPLGAASQVLPSLLKAQVALAAVALLVAFQVVWVMSARTYRPLRAIIATAEDISTRTLTVRIPDTWRDRTLRDLIRVLNAMVARLQAAFETQTRFVANTAHELRSPLAAMRAELEVALRRDRSPAEYRAALEGALSDTVRLAALAEHLLVLTRYERGASFTFERDVALAPLLERVAAEVRHSAGGAVSVSAAPSLLIDGDPVSLERMVANLLRNGVQAGGSPVSVAAGAGEDGVWITVQDQGRGIPREALPKIFEPFYRGDPARSHDGGAGLGLAIVKAAVDGHGGTISVESEVGRGTLFRIWLPRRG